jgi:conjugative relaxase-like TrwC/TraI family protein
VLTIRKIQTKVGDRRGALAAARYVLDEVDSAQAFAREGDADVVPPRAGAVWVGSATGLGQLGLQRGSAVELEQLVAALQGRHATSGVQVRRPGHVKALDPDGGRLLDERGKPYSHEVVNCWDLTFSVPKSVSVVWAVAGQGLRAQIEQAVLDAAYRSVDFLVRTRPVVEGKEVAQGFVGAASLHVTARRARGEAVPSPQLHVHMATVGVVDRAGTLRSLESAPLFKRSGMRLGGAIGRAALARSLVGLGFPIEACTGRGKRYFEIAGVPRALRERFSGRARDVARWAAALEERSGAPVGSRVAAAGAVATRPGKERVSPAEVQAAWEAIALEDGFDRGAAERLATDPPAPELEREEVLRQAREAVLGRLWAEGPTVSVWQVQAIAVEQATRGLTEEEALALVGRMEAAGELVVVDRWRVTSREIREMERHVEAVAAGSGASGPGLSRAAVDTGIAVAEASLDGHELADEQRDAVELLTSGAGWVCLTGRPGTGKGPVLKAVAAAYRREGWQVIACAADGATATDVAHLIEAPAITLEQLRVRLESESITVGARTVIVMEEASKTGLRDWELLARLREQHEVRIVAVGDARQIGAVECPGMLGVMLEDGRVLSRRLEQVRRHRDPDDQSRAHRWLGEYHAHLYEGETSDAIGVLQRERAIVSCHSRGDAMERMVKRWDERRVELAETYGVGVRDLMMVVYGTNEEVDEVNRLAQARRVAGGELGAESVEALDRGYRLHAGDVVMLRRAAYQPAPERPGGRRPPRVVNGTMGLITAVDPVADRVRVVFDEPGEVKREVTVDMRELRAQRRAVEAAIAAGEMTPDDAARVPSLWLGYAGHPFPLQGKTFFALFSLWGERYQRLVDVISGDARAKSFLEVFFHLEGADLENPDQTPLQQMAKRLEAPEHKDASIAYATREEHFQRTGETVTNLPIVEHWPTSEPAPDWPLLDIATLAHDSGPERPTGDPLRHHHTHLGPERLARITRRADELAPHAARLDDEQLETALDAAEESIVRLDPHAALELRRIERDRLHLTARTTAARERAERLEAQAEQLRGAGARRERADLLAEAAARQHDAAQDAERLARLDTRERELHDHGRHLDDWLTAEGETLARSTAAERELTRRRERAGERATHAPDTAEPARAHEPAGEGLDVGG